jgi:hypothetical protein
MPFLSHARDMVVRDQAGTMLYKEPVKDECLGRDIRQNWNASME